MLSLLNSFVLLVFIFTSIFGLSYLLTKYQYDNRLSQISFRKRLTRNTMGLILMIFGILKLYDLRKFVEIFSKYDIISKHVDGWAYLYPFLEVSLGLILLTRPNVRNFDILSVVLLMIVSLLSVGLSIVSGKKLRCGCLGSFFHIPLSYTTLSENIMMIAMAQALFHSK